jgi:hypothetical protein
MASPHQQLLRRLEQQAQHLLPLLRVRQARKAVTPHGKTISTYRE